MQLNRFLFIIYAISLLSCASQSKLSNTIDRPSFHPDKDLLLVHYDCKTDVDDLHSIAAFASLIRMPAYKQLNYHAVAGAYGVQEGLYVPPILLFDKAFPNQWSDAHRDFDKALDQVFSKVKPVLMSGGNVWIAEAGQSDFSASLVKHIQANMNSINTRKRIHLVQHSNWNEKVTDQEKLSFVKQQTAYHKIPDGNALNNGTPGFKTPKMIAWERSITDQELLQIWSMATEAAHTYNGLEGRYVNTAIEAGGLDFSDFSEVHWILNLSDIDNAADYINYLKE